eukprot:6205847-Pleurochrysis_carterae.AAC.1
MKHPSSSAWNAHPTIKCTDTYRRRLQGRPHLACALTVRISAVNISTARFKKCLRGAKAVYHIQLRANATSNISLSRPSFAHETLAIAI